VLVIFSFWGLAHHERNPKLVSVLKLGFIGKFS